MQACLLNCNAVCRTAPAVSKFFQQAMLIISSKVWLSSSLIYRTKLLWIVIKLKGLVFTLLILYFSLSKSSSTWTKKYIENQYQVSSIADTYTILRNQYDKYSIYLITNLDIHSNLSKLDMYLNLIQIHTYILI